MFVALGLEEVMGFAMGVESFWEEVLVNARNLCCIGGLWLGLKVGSKIAMTFDSVKVEVVSANP